METPEQELSRKLQERGYGIPPTPDSSVNPVDLIGGLLGGGLILAGIVVEGLWKSGKWVVKKAVNRKK